MKTLLSLSLLLALAPPALAQALPEVLRSLPNAPDWQSADLTYETALRQLQSAQAAAGLRVNLGGDYNLNAPLESSSNSQSTLRVSSNATLGVLPWSSAQDSIRSAQRGLERAALDRRDTRNNLVVNLTTQYFNLRQAAADLTIAQATQAVRERQVQVVTAQNAAGQATHEQVLTAQQNLETARVNLINTQGSLELSRLTLTNTVGTRVTETPTAPVEPNLPTGTLEQLTTQALSRRSDVLRAQSRLEDARDALSNVNRDRWLPDSSVSLGYGERTGQTQGAQLSAGLNFKNGNATLTGSYPVIAETGTGTRSTSLSLGLSVSLPLLDPSTDSRIASAQTALQSAQLALESARRAAELDVRQRYLEAQTTKARIAVSRASLATANQSLETARAKLQAGTGTQLDVENAGLNVQQLTRDLEAATATAQLAVLRLKNALGLELFGGNT